MDDRSYMLLGPIAIVAMTFGPIALACGGWFLARRIRHGWLLHLLLVPALYANDWVFGRMFFFAAGDDGDGNGYAGAGVALIPPLIAFVLTVVGYYFTLALVGLNRMHAARMSSRSRG